MGQRIAILGMGALGQFLAKRLKEHSGFELAYVWNRSQVNLEDVSCPKYFGQQDILALTLQHQADLVIECAHPQVVLDFGASILRYVDFMPTSLTAFAIQNALLQEYQDLARTHHRRLFIPAGASWGIQDIIAMVKTNRLESLEVNMTFAQDALKLTKEVLMDSNEISLVASGSIEELARLAPNNVNTMVALALAVGSFDQNKIKGALYADPQDHTHRVEIVVRGIAGYEVRTLRINPAKAGAVTGSQTFFSFLASVLKTQESENGLIFV